MSIQVSTKNASIYVNINGVQAAITAEEARTLADQLLSAIPRAAAEQTLLDHSQLALKYKDA